MKLCVDPLQMLTPLSWFPKVTRPLALVPMKFPTMVLLIVPAFINEIPSSSFPLITFLSSGVAPPMRL